MNQSIQVERFAAAELRAFCEAAFLAIGATPEEVPVLADGLMTAELRTHPGQGQGLRRLPAYHARVRAGVIRPGVEPVTLVDTPALSVVDARQTFGTVAALRAMETALAKARVLGVGVVGVRNSTHLGMASYAPLQAARRGLVGICLTNAGPELAAWGGLTPVLGTNPWGIAVPSNLGFPLTLDIALTTAGKGMLRWHLRQGLPIPDDWALTPEGATTTDPAAALDGPLLAIGGYKGVGLSFMTDVLAGVLTGAAFGAGPFSDPQRQDVGHLLLALDPAFFGDPDRFLARVGELVDQLHRSELRPGFDEVLVPGELEHRRETDRLRDGIDVDAEVVSELRSLAEELGVPMPRPVTQAEDD